MNMNSNKDYGIIRGANNYRLVRKIAQGGMGTIYEAQQYGAEGFIKTMVIKAILAKYSDNKEFVDMFIGEAKLVANLVHENIVQIYQLGRDINGMYYIAMEYMDGINLENFLLRHRELERPVPIELGCFIAARICRGLEYAHAKCGDDAKSLGIVHRDVSPKNILINKEGTVRLTDFGVAKARRYMDQQEGEVLMGKVEFMSPEQADYQITDARSDLFSLGIVLYELLTDINPFEVDDVNETLERVKTHPIPDPREYRKDIPEDVVNIIMKSLQRSLKKRYQDATSMGYDLEYYMYHDRYGPTVQVLAKYLKELYSEDELNHRDNSSDSSAIDIDTTSETTWQARSDN